MTEVDLTSVRQYVEILRWVEARTAEIAELKDKARAEIEAAMGDADVGLLDGEPAIHWGSHKRNSFDSSAFRADHPDLYEEYKTMKSVRRFEVLDG